MRILAIADIHNDVENMLQFLDKAKSMNFDVIVCPGDFTDIAPKGFSQKEIGILLLEELKSTGKPIIAVPGNWDIDLVDFFEKDDVSVHGRGKKIGDVGFYGFGGAKTPFGTAYEPEESELEEGIRKSYEDVKDAKYKVLVTHNPPKDTRVDTITTGVHVGSAAVRKFIEKHQPDAVVCGHIHEARGKDEIGRSKIVNPGRFPEGYCGIVDINDDGTDIKIVNLI